MNTGKVGIITFHFVNNFGGALQAYALYRTIRDEMGADCEIIDYINPFIRLTDTLRLLPVTKRYKVVIAAVRSLPKRLNRLARFKRFIRDNCVLTGRYASSPAIKLSPPDCEYYICGSDQIWNPLLTGGYAGAYFLDFARPGRKKISYAPSFGTAKGISLFSGRIGRALKGFDALSVREGDSVEMVKNMTGKPVEQLIDPTFLLREDEWKKVAITPAEKEKYILLYIMQKDERIYSYARRIKQRYGYKLIEISRYGYRHPFVDESVVDVGPAEFLGYILNAEGVCTNSYHGFVFSVIFDKNLFLILSRRFRMRILNLAELLHISMVQDMESEEAIKPLEYDRDLVIKTIDIERKKSIDYLERNLGKDISGK